MSQVPLHYLARPYQVAVWRAFEAGCRRLITVWHRRAGKDLTALNMAITRMITEPGNYYYYYPTGILGRKSMWDGKDRDGVPFLDAIPPELVLNANATEMKLTLRCRGGLESLFQVVGADKLDVVGPNPRGVVFSEYSKMNPKAWDYTRPILAENDGWAIFTYTPRGRNHGYGLFKLACGNPNWFAELLTVEMTGAISLDAIDEDRNSGMSEEMVQQEYYCSFDLGVEGSYYGRLMQVVVTSGRLCSVPVDDSVPVFTFWDLGIGDSTSIWFVQFVGLEIHLVDFYQSSGYGMKHYAEILQSKKYLYGGHYGPHDLTQRSLQTGVSLLRTSEDLGIRFTLVPRTDIMPGIESVRSILGRCWFDSVRCEFGVSCLEQYHAHYDETKQVFSSKPEHDWSSHCADAFRMLAVALRMNMVGTDSDSRPVRRQLPMESDRGYRVLDVGRGVSSDYSVLRR